MDKSPKILIEQKQTAQSAHPFIKDVNLQNLDRSKLQPALRKFLLLMRGPDEDAYLDTDIPWDKREEIRKQILKQAENEHASFFYSAYIKNISESTGYFEEESQMTVPVELVKGRYLDTHGLEISEVSSFQEITSLLTEQKKLKEGYKAGTYDFEEYDEEFNSLQQRIEDHFRHVKPEDLQFTGTPVSKEDLEDFRFLLQKGFRATLEQNLGVSLKELTLSEQFYFLNYSKELTNKESEKFISFCKRYGTVGLRTFLSIEHGGKEMGDKILSLGDGQKLSKEVAEKLFTKYGELIDQVDGITKTLKEKISSGMHSNPADEAAVKENFLLRAKNLLEKYANNPHKNTEDIIYELGSIEAENVVTLSIFQALRDTKSISFEDIKDFSFAGMYHTAEFITHQEQAEMEAIIEKNYKNAPVEVKNAVLKSFQKAIAVGYSDVDFPTLKCKGKIVAFTRHDYGAYGSDNEYGKKVYFGSFNVDPDFANGEVGSAMIERTVDEIAKTHIVEADCNAESPIGAKYIESGFSAIDFYDFHGWPSFKIERDDSRKSTTLGKNLSKEEIIANVKNGFYEKENKRIEILSAAKQNDLMSLFESAIKRGNIISRYFYDAQKKEWIAVTEPKLAVVEQE